MRAVSEAAADALTTSHGIASSVGIFLDGAPLIDVPVVAGTVNGDDSMAVPGSLSLTLPRYVVVNDVEVDLLPTSVGSPLGCDGHRLAVTYLIDLPGAGREAVALPWHRVESWDENDDGTITVAAASLEAVIAEARFLAPVPIAAGTTYDAAARTVAGGLLPIQVSASARNTEAQVFEEDRLESLRTLVTSWPARMFVDDAGALQIVPPYNDATDPVVFTLTDGENGTLVVAPRSGKRTTYNAVKATGEAIADVAPVSAVAYITQGPRRYNGPYGNVPYFYSSPLLTTEAQCLAAAQTILTRLQTEAEETTIVCAPDPRLQLGDVGLVTSQGRTFYARIRKLSLPLVAVGGPMSLTVTEVTR